MAPGLAPRAASLSICGLVTAWAKLAPTMATSLLADRLGLSRHESPLRYKLRRLLRQTGNVENLTIEQWLLDIANARGARVVTRPAATCAPAVPPASFLTDEELVVACCQPNAVDHPQLLRPAAQLVSRGRLNLPRLVLVARRERAGGVLAELARQALKVEPDHPAWNYLAEVFKDERPLRDTIIHWTRLAEPIMARNKPNAQGWRLVA